MQRIARQIQRVVVTVPRVGLCPSAQISRSAYHTIGASGTMTFCKKATKFTTSGTLDMVQTIIARGYKNKMLGRPLKTKQCAAKRFIKTGSGKLKHGHTGKAHLNTGKSRVRLARLNQKSFLTGVLFKKMNKLILTGK